MSMKKQKKLGDNMKNKKGSELCVDDRRYVLAAYVHRFTGQHKPNWALNSDRDYKVQFKDDQDWLDNTFFKVKNNGRLDMRSKFCESKPTWPEGQK